MPAIPEFQRRPLAPLSRTAPPADTTGAELAGIVGGAAQEIGQDAFQLGRLEKQERENQLQRDEAAFKQIDTAAARIEAGKLGVELEGRLDAASRQSATPDEFQSRASGEVDRMVGGISNPRTQGFFSKVAADAMKRNAIAFRKREEERRFVQMKGDLEASVEGLGQQTLSAFQDSSIPVEERLSLLQFHTGQASDLVATAEQAGALGPASADELREESAAALARAATFGLMESEPEEVEGFLARVVDEGVLSIDERTRLLEQANAFQKAKANRLKLAEAQRVSETKADFLTRALEGEAPTLIERETALAAGDITPKFDRGLEKLLQVKQGAEASNPQQALELETAIASLPSRLNRRGRRVVEDDAEAFELLASAYDQVVDAAGSGAITSAKAAGYLKQLTPAFNESSKEVLSRAANEVLNVQWGQDDISSWIPDEAGQLEAIEGFQTMYLSRLNEYEASVGRRAGPNELLVISDTVVQDFQAGMRAADPESADIPLGSVVSHPRFGVVKVTGFFKNGRPMLDDDLTAPVDEASRRQGLPWRDRVEQAFGPRR